MLSKVIRVRYGKGVLKPLVRIKGLRNGIYLLRL